MIRRTTLRSSPPKDDNTTIGEEKCDIQVQPSPPLMVALLLVVSGSLSAIPASAAPRPAQATKSDDKSGAAAGMANMQSRYGGPSYGGAPALAVTAALVKAGGGPKNYSTAKALTSMVGADLVGAEVKKLTDQYGKDKVGQWLTVFDFAVKDALKYATAAGVKLPKASLKGKELATTLVTAGLDADGTFYVEFLLDKAVTHGIHEKVMDDIDAKYGAEGDADYHRITNQAMYDVAQALGAKQVKLASFH